MRYWIPGYWEWVNKHYVQSVFIFGIMVSAVLSFLKIQCFSDIPKLQEMGVWMSVFFFTVLWHGIFVVFFHTRTILCNGESFEELYEKARLASLKGNSDLALFYFERMHRTAPRDEDVIYQLGKAYLETGRTLQAKKLFRKYLSGPKAKWAHEVKDLMGEGISA